MEDHALTADSFAVSCIGLGWVHIFRFAMGWLGLGHLVNGLGRVNENGPTDNSVCVCLCLNHDWSTKYSYMIFDSAIYKKLTANSTTVFLHCWYCYIRHTGTTFLL